MRSYIFILALLLIGAVGCDQKREVTVSTDRGGSTSTSDGSTDTVVYQYNYDTTITLGGSDEKQDDQAPEGSSVKNITVASPKPGDIVKGPTFLVSGSSRTFENALRYRLRGASGNVIDEGHLTSKGSMGQFGPYSFTARTNGQTGAAVLEVFQNSAKDGSEIDKVSIPVTLGAGETSGASTQINIYLSNTKRGGTDCTKVFAVSRTVPKQAAIGEAAIEQLLLGPTESEKRDGYSSQLPPGTSLRTLRIANGTASADFNSTLRSAAGACRVQAIRSQIEQTLRQFPSVARVEITSDGKKSGVLEP